MFLRMDLKALELQIGPVKATPIKASPGECRREIWLYLRRR
jgi:hypothetical protein